MSLSHVMLNNTVNQYKPLGEMDDDHIMSEPDITVSLSYCSLAEYFMEECQIIDDCSGKY